MGCKMDYLNVVLVVALLTGARRRDHELYSPAILTSTTRLPQQLNKPTLLRALLVGQIM